MEGFKRIILVVFAVGILAADHPVSLIQADLENGIITELEAVELRARSLFFSETLPEKYRIENVTPLKCGHIIHQDAMDNLDELPFDLQSRLVDSPSAESMNRNNRVIYTSTGGLFRISYTTTGSDAVSTYDGDGSGTPDYIENMGDYFDDAIGWVITNGWNNPLDYTGNSQFYVTVENLSGVYGYVPGNSYHQIWMDNSLSDRYNKLTGCHELFHLVQHTYTVSSSWFKEASSMWIEERMYDSLDGYEGYESAFQTKPHYSLDTFISGELYQYGAVLWNFFLEENFGNAAIKTIWEKSYSNAVTAANSYLSDNGSSVTEEFPKFVAWNYFTGSRANGTYEGGEYEEASNFTGASHAGTYTNQVYNFTPGTDYLPDHLGTNYIRVNRSGSTGHLVIEFDGDASRDWDLQIYTRSGSNYDGTEISIDGNGDALYVLNDWTNYSSVTINPTVLNTTGYNAEYILNVTPVNTLVLMGSTSLAVSGNDDYPDPGETVNLTVTFTNYGDPVYNATATLSTSSSDVSITDATSTFSFIGTNGTASNADDPFDISINSDADPGVIEFSLSLNAGSTNYVTEDWSMNVGLPGILLVDDDNGGSTQEAIVEALDAMGTSYELKDRASSTITSMNMNSRNIVIWNTGEVSSNALSQAERSAIKGYLDAGKSLFLVGDHLAQQLTGTNLLDDYLNMHYGGTRGTSWLKGVAGDPLGVSNSNWALVTAGASGVDSVAAKADPRSSISFYINGDDDHGGILRYSSPEYKAVLASFSIDKVSATNASFMEPVDVVTKVLEYLDSDISYPDAVSLSSPSAGTTQTLDSDDDAINFTWSGEVTGVTYDFYMSSSSTSIEPVYIMENVSGGSLSLSYQDMVGAFGYVENQTVYWGVASEKDLEVSVSDLSSLTFTVSQNVGVGSEETVPNVFSVSQNYPNPFNPETHMDIAVPETGLLTASVFDLSGREVAVLSNGIMHPGNHSISWNGKDDSGLSVPSGVYMLLVRYNGKTKSQKLVLMK